MPKEKRKGGFKAKQEKGWDPRICDPFDAVPIAAQNIEIAVDAKSNICLRKTLVPTPGVQNWFVRKLGFKRSVRIRLDERGSWFWNQIDGLRDLGEIQKGMRTEFLLKKKESEKAVILFVKMLMVRHLIYLEIKRPTEQQGVREASS